jgi:hypothetical protein
MALSATRPRPGKVGRRSRLALVALAASLLGGIAAAQPASALDVTYTNGSPQVVNLQSKTFRLARRDKIVGNMNLSVFSDGQYNFDVHAVNNLAARRKVGWLCTIKSRSGTAFTFSHEDTVMAAGDDHYDRTLSDKKDNLVRDWPNIWAGLSFARCSMTVAGDLKGLYNDMKPDLGEVKEVVAIVGTFLG